MTRDQFLEILQDNKVAIKENINDFSVLLPIIRDALEEKSIRFTPLAPRTIAAYVRASLLSENPLRVYKNADRRLLLEDDDMFIIYLNSKKDVWEIDRGYVEIAMKERGLEFMSTYFIRWAEESFDALKERGAFWLN